MFCSGAVEILLIDFILVAGSSWNKSSISDHHHDMGPDHPIAKFRQKMRRRLRRNPAFPFEMNFELVYTFTGLSSPRDVVISYNHSVILISDCLNCRIQVYNLKTKYYILSVRPPSIQYPHNMCIEENYDGKHNDALIIVFYICGLDKAIVKCDLKTLLLNFGKFSSIYQANNFTFQTIRGIKAANKKIYAVDSCEKCIKILNSETGQMIEVVSPFNGYDLAFIDDNTVAVATSDGIEILNTDLNWKMIRAFRQDFLSFSASITMDSAARRLILCDKDKDKIYCFTLDGIKIKSFEKRREGNSLTALCLNEITGELMVVDETRDRVLVFK